MKKRILLATCTISTLFFTGIPLALAKQQGGTLNVPVLSSGFTENFNPYTTGGILGGVMFEPLFVFDNTKGETHFLLAESAEYSQDLKTLTLKLRDGLQWSDGLSLTAQDVEFSFKLIQKFPEFDLNSIWLNGELLQVRAIDEQNVEFTLSHPDSTFLWRLAAYYILPAHIWSNVNSILSFKNVNPIGSGPMTRVSKLDLKQMQLCRNDNYYLKARPYLDCINFKSYQSDTEMHTALIDGEIDLGTNYIDDVEYEFIAIDKVNNHFWYPANHAVNLYINTKKKPFDDLRVRQALSMAINRENMVDIGFYDYPKANYNVGGLSEVFEVYVDKKLNKKHSDLTKYNVRKARALLDKAGVIDSSGDGYRNNTDGSEIDVNIDVASNWTDWIKIVQMLKTYFAEIGIRANVNILNWSNYLESLQKGNYAMSISWSVVNHHPIATFREYYHSSQINKGYHVNHGVNSKEIDDLIDSFSKINNEEGQHNIIYELQKFTAENVPFIPLFSNPTWFQYSTKKIAGWPNEDNPYIQPVWGDAGKRRIIINNLYFK